ncbi:unnamed protein product [Didymodactylos carnosus]|uniref:Uncharacterized protein n=1 Tax=Didymodactylos carnosus TaxID=1234261 RepID=A0A814DCK8_9BILA|nr:unnamed protein product [Didymodactylos carnosus]CAF1197221.1 unnamed protein product [Didymodactylos carnosus]CAF3729252.1 unnamed protein product [Didymodactylos carnosus]CAF4007470.1 unnamed protein product [Didymodactylos carnosus]
MSDGLCKRSCNPVTGVHLTNKDNDDNQRRRRSVLDDPSTTPSTARTSQKAEQICNVYIDNFVNTPLGSNLTDKNIANAKSACTVDVTATGSAQFAKSNIAILVIQAITADSSTFSNLSESLSTKLEQALDDANETMTLSEQQVEEIINPTTSTTSTTSSTTSKTTSTTAPPIRNVDAVIGLSQVENVKPACKLSTVANSQSLFLNISADYDAACGAQSRRSLISFSELDAVLTTNRQLKSVSLKLYGPSVNETGDGGNWAYGTTGITNEVYIRRVLASWTTSVTWATQPSTTTTNQVLIPASTQEWNYNVTLDITHLVNDIKTLRKNYGFKLQLPSENFDKHQDYQYRPIFEQDLFGKCNNTPRLDMAKQSCQKITQYEQCIFDVLVTNDTTMSQIHMEFHTNIDNWREFANLVQQDNKNGVSNALHSTTEELCQDRTPSLEELKIALRQMKNRKAPGNDDVSADILKAGGLQVLIEAGVSGIHLAYGSNDFHHGANEKYEDFEILTLMYADDLVTICNSMQDLEKFIQVDSPVYIDN